MHAQLPPSRLARRRTAAAADAITSLHEREDWEDSTRSPARITLARTALALVALALAAPAPAQQVPAANPTPYARAIAAGYKALTYCNSIFAAGRTTSQIDAEELHGIYPEYDAIVPTLTARVDRSHQVISVDWSDTMQSRLAEWSPKEGCWLHPIGSEGIAVGGRSNERAPPVSLGADPRRWPIGDAGVRPRPTSALAGHMAAAFDNSTYGTGKTTGVVILSNGAIIAERYAVGWGPFVPNRTWSVAKSITGTLVGMAGINPSEPARIPEWQANGPLEPRGQITLDNLLRMASGLHSGAAGNRTDAIYFGGVAVTEEATGWPLEAGPGTRFRYANDDILLAARAMRATLGEQRYRDFPTAALFAPLGMRHTQAGQDWRGNYILSSQVWSTARDLARLGQFWLQDGVWQGKRLLPEGWVKYMTTPSGPQPETGPGYGATLWLFGPAQGLPAGSYAAQGNRGQYVMVIPSAKLVIVRRGEDGGAARFDIAKFTADVLAATR